MQDFFLVCVLYCVSSQKTHKEPALVDVQEQAEVEEDVRHRTAHYHFARHRTTKHLMMSWVM